MDGSADGLGLSETLHADIRCGIAIRSWAKASVQGAASAANKIAHREQFAVEAACMVTLTRNPEDRGCRDGRDLLAASDRWVQTVGAIVPIPLTAKRLLGI